jgi:hypothetical protein
MKTTAVIAIGIALLAGAVRAQEKKPVPSDYARVAVPGCSKGSIFTAGVRTVDEPGSLDVPPGMHLRMNGPKKVIAEIKAHEGSMIEVTGLVKKGQYNPSGVAVGGGVRIAPGPAPGSSVAGNAGINQSFIDVEGWRQIAGDCRSR